MTVLRRKPLRGKPYVNHMTNGQHINSPISPLKINVIHNLFKERVRVYLSGVNVQKRTEPEYINARITNTLSYMKRRFKIE